MVYPVSLFSFLERLCKSDENKMISLRKILTHTPLSLRPCKIISHGKTKYSQLLHSSQIINNLKGISTSPGRDASPSEVTSPQFVRFPQQFAGTHLYRESKVSCPRTQHNGPGQGWNPDRSLRSRTH